MLIKNIYIYVFYVILIIPVSVNSQQYTVNTTNLGITDPGNTSGSLDKMMNLAINYADNTGGTAVINVAAGGLIPLRYALPVLNHGQGKVVITSNGNNTTEGIIGDIYGVTGFQIDCVGDVEIKDLKITNLQYGIYITSPNITSTLQNPEVLISNNILSTSKSGVKGILANGTQGENYDIDITNNDFIGAGYNSYSRGCFIQIGLASSVPNESYTGLNINISNSTFNDLGAAMCILSDETSVLFEANVDVHNNTINNCRDGYYALRPKEDWKIYQNSFDFINRAITLGNYDLQYPSSFSYNFDFVQGVKNDNNFISNVQEQATTNSGTWLGYSYFLAGMDQVNLKNLINTEGTVALPVNHLGSEISNCLIQLPNTQIQCAGDLPPEPILSNGGTGEILSASINAGDLVLDYELQNSDPALGDHKVEFFICDDNGSLLQYLGSEIKSVFPGPYTKVFSNINPIGNRVGITVTPVQVNDNTSCVYTLPIDGFSSNSNCVTSFNPKPDEDYWISAWVKVNHVNQVKSYSNVSMDLQFLGNNNSSVTFTPTGEIIDGWQRIVGKFTVPDGTNYLGVRFNGHSTIDTYFDDIRIHPFNASMKSYVYDGETFWLTSELDDNNYATFYEYDEEGGLIRIKKETSRGVVTIQETRSNTVKDQNP